MFLHEDTRILLGPAEQRGNQVVLLRFEVERQARAAFRPQPSRSVGVVREERRDHALEEGAQAPMVRKEMIRHRPFGRVTKRPRVLVPRQRSSKEPRSPHRMTRSERECLLDAIETPNAQTLRVAIRLTPPRSSVEE